MQQKVLRNVVFLGILLLASGMIQTGCIDEPTIPVPPEMTAHVRFINAIPGGSAVDVWIDGVNVAAGTAFKQATGYNTIGAGDRQLKVTAAGSATELFSQKVTLASYTQQTIIFYDSDTAPKMLQTIERYTYSNEGKPLADSNRTAVKMIHVCKGTGAVQLRIDALTGPVVLSGPLGVDKKPTDAGFAYGAPSQYSMPPIYSLTAGAYNFFPLTTAGLEVLLPPNYPSGSFQHTGESGKRYTFVLLGTNSDADVLILTDDGI